MKEKVIICAILLAISFSPISSLSLFKMTQSLDSSNVCQNITFGLIPYEDNCNYFIICQNENPRVERCPSRSIFDPTVLACVLGDPETCEIFTTTTEPTTTTREIPTECPQIDDPVNPIFLPDHNDCSKYFLCFNGTKLARSCSDNLLWDVEHDRCDFPQNVNCELQRTTTSSPITTTTEMTFLCRDWQNCPQTGFGYLPHMTNCARFFYCDRGIRHLRQCDYGQIFDVVTMRCNEPSFSICARYTQCT